MLLYTLSVVFSIASQAQEHSFSAFEKRFIQEYENLNIPPIRIAYLETLADIPEHEQLAKQEQFFKRVLEEVKTFKQADLTAKQELNLAIILYEAELNLFRIQLSKKWRGKLPQKAASIIHIEHGKDWYQYLLKRWVDIEVNPDSLFAFGKREVAFVKHKMEKIRVELGYNTDEFNQHINDSSFFLNEVSLVQKRFELAQQKMQRKYAHLFPFADEMKAAKIAQGTDSNLAHVPAFYNAGTFYFNYFNQAFNQRQIEWIYAHEAFPGHHYQGFVNGKVDRSALLDLFWYPGFVEGWGAYVEYLDIYSSPMDEYGKYEWDLIRSVRVVLDVGINYYGWSDKQAFTYWKTHIKDQDQVAWREISRMKRWPAQVITYKYGAHEMLCLLAKAKESENFQWIDFHQRLLENGDVPISILRERFEKEK
tara:strand:- start:932 stop:2197 length:1266 start_codon:yes stop_codon:yes gene_type:complete